MNRTIASVLAFAALLTFGVALAVAGDSHEGKFVKGGNGQVTMTDMDGKNEHSHDIAPKAKVTLNGKPATIAELRRGVVITVTTEEQNGKTVATAIAARDDQTSPPVAASFSARAGKLIGSEIKNGSGESLGSLYDVVLDSRNGCIRYAVLSHGGLFNVGNKLFAIPWTAMTLKEDPEHKEKYHFVLNVSLDQLKDDPGFDKNRWPEMADPKWAASTGTSTNP